MKPTKPFLTFQAPQADLPIIQLTLAFSEILFNNFNHYRCFS